MKKILCGIILFYSSHTYSTPENIEFIFISEDSSVSLLKLLGPSFQFSQKIVEVDNTLYNCVPMGDEGCFHPQLGYLEKDKKDKIKGATKEVQYKESKLKTFNSTDVNLVDCKEGNYFDIFCGKSTKDKAAVNVDVEVWVDTSSSMRNMDYSKGLDNCFRHQLLKKVKRGCAAGGILFSTFDTSIKEISDTSMSCVNYGLNNTDRLIKWIKDSTVKNLFIITDIDEQNSKLADFIDSVGGKTYGLSVEKFTSKKLLEFSQNIMKTCSKK